MTDMNSLSWSVDGMLDRLGGDEELAHQLVELFLAELPRMLDDLRQAIAAESADRIRRAAHAFKGSASNFIDEGPVSTALQIELLGKDDRVGDVLPLFRRLEREARELETAMRAFEEGKSCAS